MMANMPALASTVPLSPESWQGRNLNNKGPAEGCDLYTSDERAPAGAGMSVLHLVDGTQVQYTPEDVPDFPQVSFTGRDGVRQLLLEWRDSRRVTVRGHGVALCKYPAIYGKRAGNKVNTWDRYRMVWHQWKVSVSSAMFSTVAATHLVSFSPVQTIAEEYERRAVDIEVFLDRFTNAQGRFLGVKPIMSQIKREWDMPTDAVHHVATAVAATASSVP